MKVCKLSVSGGILLQTAPPLSCQPMDGVDRDAELSFSGTTSGNVGLHLLEEKRKRLRVGEGCATFDEVSLTVSEFRPRNRWYRPALLSESALP